MSCSRSSDRRTTGRLGRAVAAAAAALFLSIVAAEGARAHGGGFREVPIGPGGGPQPASPELPAPVTVNPGSGSGRERASFDPGTWFTWWMLNGAAYLPERFGEAAERTEVAGLFGVGLGRDGLRGLEERRMDEERARVLEPVLSGILDPAREESDVLVGTALIALGRSAGDPSAVAVLLRHAQDPRASQEIRESATLALGLLRRGDPNRRLPAADLARLRRHLLVLLDDEDAPQRVRAFAALSLGLLGDQPFLDEPFERHGLALTRGLWRRLFRRHASQDVPVALLTAIGMQPREGVAGGVTEGLRAIALGRPVAGRRFDPIERSHAVTALARLGAPGWWRVCLSVLPGTREHGALRAGALIALGAAAPELPAAEREAVAEAVRRSLRHEGQFVVEGQALIALSRLLRAEIDRPGSWSEEGVEGLGAFLRDQAASGSTLVRPFGAFALALLCHRLEPSTRTAAVLLKDCRCTLHETFVRGRGPDDLVAAYALACGLAGAEAASEPLCEALIDTGRSPFLRAQCAVSLGLLGRGTPGVRAALEKAQIERRSSAVYLEASRALSVLGVPGTTPRMLDRMRTTTARSSLAAMAAALGRTQDLDAGPALAEIALDGEASLDQRALAIVALGLLFDPERRPSRTRLTTFANYPARTPALQQAYNIF